MKLALVIGSLAGGGAERVMTTLANAWVERGWGVTIITLDDGAPSFFALDERVERRSLGLASRSSGVLQAIRANVRRVRVLRKTLRSCAPDLILAFTEVVNVLTLVAARGLGRPVVVSERTDPAAHHIGAVWSWLRGRTYRWAARVVVQVAAYADSLPRALHERIAVIPNAVGPPQTAAKTDGATAANARVALTTARRVVGLGRLEHVKGFDLLLEAFARCMPGSEDWGLVIWGEGSERQRLEQRADALGIAQRVAFPGVCTRPIEALGGAHLFVLSSRFEGFPNALLEAMACGVAVVAFDCSAGVRTIVRAGVDGLLVAAEDEHALGAAMQTLMQDETQRRALGAHARAVTKRFSQELVLGRWEALFRELVAPLPAAASTLREVPS